MRILEILLFSTTIILIMGLVLAEEEPFLRDLNSEYNNYFNNTDYLNHTTEYSIGTIPEPVLAPVDFSHLNFSYEMDALNGNAIVNADIPPYFHLADQGRLTPVKDQGDCQVDSIFAAYSSLESYLLPNEYWDFSEQNFRNLNGLDLGPCLSGNRLGLLGYLTRWSGPVNEIDDPYNVLVTTSPSLPPVKHVQEVLFLPDIDSQYGIDTLKSFIMEYGAVVVSMYADSDYSNSTYNSYYYSGANTSINHFVTVVGWNDSFPRNYLRPDNKTLPMPADDGAFIVKDSSSYLSGNDLDDYPYLYVSYYDKQFAKQGNNTMFTAEDITNYDHNYQYDMLGMSATTGYPSRSVAWGSNNYTAVGDEILEAVSFYTRYNNMKYEVYIFSNPHYIPVQIKDYSNVYSCWANCRSNISSTFDYPGYHTVKLNKPVYLTHGEQFSVVVKFTTSSTNEYLPIPIEYPHDVVTKATANNGEGYFSSDGKLWMDANITYPNTSICIKAFTSDTGVFEKTVKNEDTGKTYTSISAAVQDPLTLNGHTIVVDNTKLQENVYVDKSVIIKSFSEDPTKTTIQALDPSRSVFRVVASDVNISGFSITGSENYGGIEVTRSSVGSIPENVLIDRNNIFDNEIGIYLKNAANCNVTNNTVARNVAGICLDFGDTNNLNANQVRSNVFGIVINSSESNTIIKNLLTGNGYGIELRLSESNNLSSNNITQNFNGGMLLESSESNSVYNNIFNNTKNVVFEDSKVNAWNTTKKLSQNIVKGQYMGGNCWLTPGGNGYSQSKECNDTNGDGICDLPYYIKIDGSNIDQLPLHFARKMIEPLPKIPINYNVLTSGFRTPKRPQHEGIDLATSNVKGKDVFATYDGKVIGVKPVVDNVAGKWVWIYHENITKTNGATVSQISTRYLHLDTITVTKGQEVKAGQNIGTVGNTGSDYYTNPRTGKKGFGPHLHFEVRQGFSPGWTSYKQTTPLNPLDFITVKTEDLRVTVHCPVDLVLKDPDGLIVDQEKSELVDGCYLEVGIDEDEAPGYDSIGVGKRKSGTYTITVKPEPNASSTDEYTLEVNANDQTIILAENVKVNDIPTRPYTIMSDDTGITVIDEDKPPELAPIGNKTINENVLLKFAILAIDADGDAITYSTTGLPNGATLNETTGEFSWTPGVGTEGNYTVTFTAMANNQNDSETIKIHVITGDWNPWNDSDSDGGESITLSELQDAIYDWRFGIATSTGELVDLTRLQDLIYQWRFG